VAAAHDAESPRRRIGAREKYAVARAFAPVTQTGGKYVESLGSGCLAEGYVSAGRESARDLDALVTYATALPWARNDGAVVVGVSSGGWAAAAYDSLPHPKVIAMVSFAGGRGGHWRYVPNLVCRSDELIRAAGSFGATASTPMLWVYAANDTYFSPDVATGIYHAFAGAGGTAELVQLGPYGDDGHQLFSGRGGSAIWGPFVEHYLASRGATP